MAKTNYILAEAIKSQFCKSKHPVKTLDILYPLVCFKEITANQLTPSLK